MSSESFYQSRRQSAQDSRDERANSRQEAREAYEFWNPPGMREFKQANPNFDPTRNPGPWWNS